MPDEVSTGEIARRLDRMERSQAESFSKIFARIDGFSEQFVSLREFDRRVGAVEEQIARAIDRKWAAVIGGSAAFITGVITAVVDLVTRGH